MWSSLTRDDFYLFDLELNRDLHPIGVSRIVIMLSGIALILCGLSFISQIDADLGLTGQVLKYGTFIYMAIIISLSLLVRFTQISYTKPYLPLICFALITLGFITPIQIGIGRFFQDEIGSQVRIYYQLLLLNIPYLVGFHLYYRKRILNGCLKRGGNGLIAMANMDQKLIVFVSLIVLAIATVLLIFTPYENYIIAILLQMGNMLLIPGFSKLLLMAGFLKRFDVECERGIEVKKKASVKTKPQEVKKEVQQKKKNLGREKKLVQERVNPRKPILVVQFICMMVLIVLLTTLSVKSALLATVIFVLSVVITFAIRKQLVKAYLKFFGRLVLNLINLVCLVYSFTLTSGVLMNKLDLSSQLFGWIGLATLFMYLAVMKLSSLKYVEKEFVDEDQEMSDVI